MPDAVNVTVDPRVVAEQLGALRQGWVWGLRSSPVWLTVLGSAYCEPPLADTPQAAGPAPVIAGDREPVLARVAEVEHPGVTGPRPVAYRILEVADTRPPPYLAMRVAGVLIAFGGAATRDQVKGVLEAAGYTGSKIRGGHSRGSRAGAKARQGLNLLRDRDLAACRGGEVWAATDVAELAAWLADSVEAAWQCGRPLTAVPPAGGPDDGGGRGVEEE